MGFFFSEQQTATDSRTVIDLAKHYGCKICPLKDQKLHHPNMPATGSKEPLFYCLGEAPGEEEDLNNKQFCGRAGRFLREKIERNLVTEGDIDKYIRWNNCARCRPPRNETPNELILECCKDSVLKDIEETRPPIIIGLGNVPLRFFLKHEGIQLWRGRRIPIKIGKHTAWFFPLLHPSFIIRSIGNSKVANWEKIFEDDLRMIREFAESGEWEDPYVESEKYEKGVKILKSDISELEKLKESRVVGLDIETYRLRPFYKDSVLLSFAISNGDYTLTFPYSPLIKENVKDFLLNSGTKVCHFLKFELEWMLHEFGPEVLLNTEWGCTLAQAYIINEKTSKQAGMLSLDTLVLQHFGFELKALSNLDRKDLRKYPIDKVLLYNGMDAKYTYKLYQKQLPKLEKKLMDRYEESVRTVKTLVIMQSEGVFVDKNKAVKFNAREEKKLIALESKILALPEIKLFEEERQTKYKINSSNHMAYIFEKIMNIPPIKMTAGGEDGQDKYSTDKFVLDVLAQKGIKLAKYTLEYREINKLKTTYIDPAPGWVYDDGILHTNFNNTVTSTGRLASESPNMQNFPKKKGVWVRELIVPPPNHIFVSIDYGQIEARVLAMASKDPVFSKMIREGYDVHKEWAIKTFDYAPEALVKTTGKKDLNDKTLDEFRSIIKNSLVFPWFYGASEESVGMTLGVNPRVMHKIYEKFWETFKGILKWQERLIKLYEKNGYVETLTGRRRHAPLGKNEIINSPIQGTASDIVVDAMNRLREYAWKTGEWQFITRLNVHDELDFFFHEDTFDEDVVTAANMMCNVPFSFVKGIPIEVEVSIGPSWGELEKVRKFTSDSN